MELKKSPKANLEKARFIFLELGFIITLSLVLIAFEWTTTRSSINKYEVEMSDVYEEEIIPITTQEEPKQLALPKPIKIVEIFEIVENEVELDDELQFEDYEVDQDSEIEIMEYSEFKGEEEEEEETEIFYIVEDMPGFRGEGLDGFRKYISQNLKYPEIATENGICGRVFVQFVVEPNGSVSNVNVIRGIDPALNAEAVRVVKSSPKWTPGKQRGKPVRVSFTFPINFKLAS